MIEEKKDQTDNSTGKQMKWGLLWKKKKVKSLLSRL